VKKHKDKKAAVVLARIYQTDEKGIEEELGGIGASVVNAEKEHFWQKLKIFYSWKFIQRLARHIYAPVPFMCCSTCCISILQGAFGNVVADLPAWNRWYSNFVSWSFLVPSCIN